MFYLAETSVHCRTGISTSLKVLKLDNCRGASIYLYMTDISLHCITCSLLYGHGMI